MSFEADLKKKIREEGALPLDQYMALCNAHYYQSQHPFGENGDFITAPEISQLFGEVIAAWLVDIMGQIGSFEKAMILECGPGRGILMKDILRILNNIKFMEGKLKVVLLENSESLRKVQSDALRGSYPVWISDINDSILRTFEGPIFVIGNEFLDALPIKQYNYLKNQWHERYVAVDENNDLYMTHYETSFAPDLQNPKEGVIFENSLAVTDFIEKTADLLNEKAGASLFIDYGYNQTSFGDSFQAVKKHQYVDPLQNPGQYDLTAHVNFDAIKKAAEKKKMHVYGPTTQGAFLIESGLGIRAEVLKSKATDAQKADIDRATERLCAPEQMGELFKVMAMSYRKLQPAGFKL